MSDDDPTPYCVEGCGRPATTSRPMGVTADGIPTVELTYDHCETSRIVVTRWIPSYIKVTCDGCNSSITWNEGDTARTCCCGNAQVCSDGSVVHRSEAISVKRTSREAPT